MKNTGKIASILAAFLLVMVASPITAQEGYPSKPIEVVVPWDAGSSVSILCRSVNEKMAEQLGQPVVMLNKPGGMTALGSTYVARSKPDGYTLLVATVGPGGFMYLPFTNPSFGYSYKDFITIAQLNSFPQTIIVRKGIPAKTLKELLAYIEKNPGTMSYTSIGVGSTGQLAMELLLLSSGIKSDIRHVPFQSGLGEIMANLLGGHVDVAIGPVTSLIKKYAEAGEIECPAILSAERYPVFPQIPTAVEQGFPDMVVTNGFTYFALGKTPMPIVKKLEGTIEKALQSEAVQETLKKLDYVATFRNSKDTKASMDAMMSNLQWENVIKKVFGEDALRRLRK